MADGFVSILDGLKCKHYSLLFCTQYFPMWLHVSAGRMLSMYQLTEEEIRSSADHAKQMSGTGGQAGMTSRLNLPTVEILKVLFCR